jgi:hypothetical protein
MSDVKTQSIEDYIASLAVPEEVVPVVDPFESATAEEVINTELVDTSSIPPTVESEDDAAVSSVARVAYTTPEASPQTITDYLQYPSNCIAGDVSAEGLSAETTRALAAESALDKRIRPVSTLRYGLVTHGDSFTGGLGATTPEKSYVGVMSADYATAIVNHGEVGNTLVDMQAKVFGTLAPQRPNPRSTAWSPTPCRRRA